MGQGVSGSSSVVHAVKTQFTPTILSKGETKGEQLSTRDAPHFYGIVNWKM